MTGDIILKNAIELIMAGEKAQAQKLLEPYLQENPHDVVAWLWKARTRPTLAARINVLETCLTHNPQDPRIEVVLAALNTQRNQYETDQHILCEI